MTDDLISRQRAIDALEKCREHCCREDEVGDKWVHYETALNEIESIPPEPTTEVATDINVGDKDTISRKAAIDAIYTRIKQIGYENDPLVLSIRQAVRDLPSSQPDVPDINVGDMISRKAAIDIISQHTFYNDYDDTDKCSLLDGLRALPSAQPEIIRCKDCKHHWTHKCMDSMPIERCDLGQTFYDAEVDYCSLANGREVTT